MASLLFLSSLALGWAVGALRAAAIKATLRLLVLSTESGRALRARLERALPSTRVAAAKAVVAHHRGKCSPTNHGNSESFLCSRAFSWVEKQIARLLLDKDAWRELFGGEPSMLVLLWWRVQCRVVRRYRKLR